MPGPEINVTPNCTVWIYFIKYEKKVFPLFGNIRATRLSVNMQSKC